MLDQSYLSTLQGPELKGRKLLGLFGVSKGLSCPSGPSKRQILTDAHEFS